MLKVLIGVVNACCNLLMIIIKMRMNFKSASKLLELWMSLYRIHILYRPVRYGSQIKNIVL